MKNILMILGLLFVNFSFSQSSKGFNIKLIDSVVFYDFDRMSKGEINSIIDARGNLNLKIIRKSFKLDKSKCVEFNEILNRKDSYGEVTASCFDPHLGIVFYSKGIPKNYINICFACNALRANYRIVAQEQGKQGNGKNAYYILNGMSKKITNYLHKLLKENNFGSTVNQ
jgi:hypothetical protein